MPQKTQKNNKSNTAKQSKTGSNYSSSSKNSSILNNLNRSNYANAKYTNYSGYSVKNSRGNTANAAALNMPGRVRDAGRYNDRLRGTRKKYPNRRRVITGKELTTPLMRKKIAEKAAAEKIHIRIRTINTEKKKLPVNVLFCVIITSFFLICLIYSQTVLNEKNVRINEINEDITFEIKKEKILANELDKKNDLNYIIDYAVNKLEMVNEDLLQKHYISGSLNDKVEVIEEKNSSIIDFPNFMSAIFKN
ncbi:MAG: hypothetical protein FWF92_11585 [Oscillospiraceae bacterium]|nr:hypothetical protein [Oscillospiraceae bacterium]